MSRRDALLALNRFGLGGRPGDLEAIAADPRQALAAELDIPDIALLPSSGLPDSPAALNAQQAYRAERRRAKEQSDADAMEPGESAGMEDSVGRVPRRILQDEISARVERAVTAETGFAERLVAFWANHFAIEADANGTVRALAGAFEREAIRPHALGRFEDMLLAVTKHPAMLSYLNNARSIGPNSRQGKRRDRGLNENHARELLELHTVGVDAGYGQEDVIALANILTGWTFAQRDRPAGMLGKFMFDLRIHEPGPQTVMGVEYADEGVAQGEAVLRDLAHHPATARHIARKLVKHFVADEPPPDLVERIATVFLDTEGDLKALALTLIDSEESWGDSKKLRSPQEFLWASLRALDARIPAGLANRMLGSLGQPLWNPPSPEGFPDQTEAWLAPDAFADRLDVSENLARRAATELDPSELLEAVVGETASAETRETVRWAESPTQGYTLLLMSPEFQWR
jgi:uncharacterized protein (DUF1800 family)